MAVGFERKKKESRHRALCDSVGAERFKMFLGQRKPKKTDDVTRKTAFEKEGGKSPSAESAYGYDIFQNVSVIGTKPNLAPLFLRKGSAVTKQTAFPGLPTRVDVWKKKTDQPEIMHACDTFRG